MEDYDSFGSSSNFSLNKILLCLFSFLNLPLIVEIPSVLGLGESVIPTALTIFILVADFILLLIFIINLIKILKIKLRQKRKVNKNINISKDKESLYCDAKTFVSNSINELNQYEINRPTELNYNDYIRKILNYYQYNVRTFSTSLTHSMYNSKEKAPIYSIQYWFVKDYYAYYKTKRGYHPRSLNSNDGWNVTGCMSFINQPILAYSHEIESAVLMIHGEKAHSCYFSKDAFKNLKGENKQLMLIPNAVHTNLYDQVNIIPFEAITQFFKKYFG